MSYFKSLLLVCPVIFALGVGRQARAENWGEPWFFPTIERATTTADVVFIASLGEDSWLAPRLMKGYHPTVVTDSHLGAIHSYCREQLPAKAFKQLRSFRLVIFARFEPYEESLASIWIMPTDCDLGSFESLRGIQVKHRRINCLPKDNSGRVVLNSTEIEQLIRCVIAAHEKSSGRVDFLTTTRCQTYFPSRPGLILNHRVERLLRTRGGPVIPKEFRDLDARHFGENPRFLFYTNASLRYVEPLLAMLRSDEPADRIYAAIRLRRYSREYLQFNTDLSNALSKWDSIRLQLNFLAKEDPYQISPPQDDGEESGVDSEAYYPVRVAALSSLVHLGVVDASQEADLNEEIHFDEWIERESSGLLTIDVERLERDWGLQPLRTVCKAPPVPSGESKSPDPQDRREHYPWLLVLATILSAVVGYKVGVYSRRK